MNSGLNSKRRYRAKGPFIFALVNNSQINIKVVKTVIA